MSAIDPAVPDDATFGSGIIIDNDDEAAES